MSEASRGAAAILLSTPTFETFYGGGLGLDRAAYLETYRNDWSWEYAEGLRRQGIKAYIYVASAGPTALHETAEGIGVRFLGLGAADRPWRAIPALQRSPLGRYAYGAANAVSMWPALRAALQEDAIAALLIQEYWTARYDVLSKRVPVPVLAIDQGMPERREIKLRKRASLPRARRVVVQTQAEREKVERYGGTAERIPNGVDTGRYGPDPAREHPPEILTVARLLDVQKRISDLIRALALLPPEWRLRIVGGGPDEQLLRDLAVELQVTDRVRFDGFVMDRDVIVDALQGTGVYAIPSTYEGLPMALLEAMSCGCAVVGSAIPAIAEVVSDGVDGLLVGTEDPPALAAAIARAYAERDRFGAAGRETIEREYSLEACGGRLAALILGDQR